MISKTRIKERMRRKTNPEIVETIINAKRTQEWTRVSELLASPSRNAIKINLRRIDAETTEGDTIIIPGKVLGTGEITKKIRIGALQFSESAREKLRGKKCEIVTINEEIKKNPKAQGIKILK